MKKLSRFLCLIGMAISARAQSTPATPVIIGCIGDSITQGVGASTQAPACAQLPRFLNKFHAVTGVYSSVSAGVGGTTSGDWAAGGAMLQGAIAAMTAAKVNVVQIMLGTNDSKVAVQTSRAAYTTNLQAVITALRAAGFNKIILHQPIYIGQPAGQWDVVISNNLIAQYGEAVVAVAAADFGYVFNGDHLGFTWFQLNPGDSADGIHPNDNGHVSLGFLWAMAYGDLFLRSPARGVRERPE